MKAASLQTFRVPPTPPLISMAHRIARRENYMRLSKKLERGDREGPVPAASYAQIAVPLAVYSYSGVEEWNGAIAFNLAERRDIRLLVDAAKAVNAEAVGAAVFDTVMTGMMRGSGFPTKKGSHDDSFATLKIFALPRGIPLPAEWLLGEIGGPDADVQAVALQSAVLLWEDDGGPWRTDVLDAFCALINNPPQQLKPELHEEVLSRLLAHDTQFVAFAGPCKSDPDDRRVAIQTWDGAGTSDASKGPKRATDYDDRPRVDIGMWVGRGSSATTTSTGSPSQSCDAWLSSGSDDVRPVPSEVAAMVMRLTQIDGRAGRWRSDARVESAAAPPQLRASDWHLSPDGVNKLRLEVQRAWQAHGNPMNSQGIATCLTQASEAPCSDFVLNIMRSSTADDFKLALSFDDLVRVVGGCCDTPPPPLSSISL